jgi:lysocardiolipin and lysophospholipid acyltransferase
MKITVRGGLTLAGCLVVCVTNFMSVSMWLYLTLFFVKHVLGEAPASSLYKLSSAYHNVLQRIYFSWVGGLLEFGLGTRFAYTVVDGEGQDHLDQHYMKAVHGEDGSRAEKHVDLDKFLRPPSKPGKAKIIIMNHHCRLDWLYMFIFFARTRGMIKHVRFVLKGELRKLPVLGWTMDMFRYVFLSRSWEKDEKYIERMVKFYDETKDTPVVFIFPEGTDLSPSNIERSQAYAAKAGLPKFHRVLNPRTTGLTAIVKMLGGPERVEEVLDFTIGYTYHAPGERPDEPSLINGHHPKKVHLLLHRYVLEGTEEAAHVNPRCVAPVDEAKLAAWTHERFAEKEQLLSRFFVSNPMGFDAADVKAVLGKQVGLACYDIDEERVRHPNRPWWRRYYQQTGLFGVLVVPLYWLLPILYFVLCTRWWLSALSTVVVLYSFTKGINAVGGLQKALLLTKVTPDQTVVQRLRRWLASRSAKEKKSA